MQPLAKVIFQSVGEYGRERFRLAELWRNWPRVMGSMADMARPLGTRKSTLLLGVEDPVTMQELSYYGPEILDRVNGFLQKKIFDKVKFDLLQGRVPLDAITVQGPEFHKPRPIRPTGFGHLVGRFPADSALGRCYAAYAALYDRAEASQDAVEEDTFGGTHERRNYA
ncbi:DUF721 domain-containing protein [Desulfovibrio inopinatus]|uniref:DUF721 domain-containing protein n=1 Tax=Desulfovibrio inopinatus TaxID=102109 RepID=UPI000407734A|nr:DUF721 domain-containing protein [Desulfovibrio inopinatus]